MCETMTLFKDGDIKNLRIDRVAYKNGTITVIEHTIDPGANKEEMKHQDNLRKVANDQHFINSDILNVAKYKNTSLFVRHTEFPAHINTP